MNSLYTYYNNVQKMAAYKQAKRMQRGVLTSQGGFSTTDPALLQVPCTIQCVVSPDELINNAYAFSSGYVYLTTADASRMRITISGSETNESTLFNVESGGIYNVTFVLSVEKTSAYVNGELVLEVNGSEDLKYYVVGCYTQSFINRLQGGYLLHRHFNYAMSADEVATLYNNGYPMGYVVPKAMRGLEPVENTDRRLTLTVNSITPVGLLAEYLPQNLMYGRDDDMIAASWLDSAKQLPLSDEYMEPLFQSIGGYDMAANGAPEIIYNE